MQATRASFALLCITALFSACKKDNSTENTCFNNMPTVRTVTNAQATIKQSGSNYYIVEQGSIDTKLNPCSLAAEFKVHDLQVIVSGNVLVTYRTIEPCCTDNFIITAITK